MATDYSWIEPSTKNIANLFGLNPEAAAKGRAMQSEQEYNAARTANTQADTGLSDYRRRLLEAQAGQHNAAAGKYTSEKGGIDLTNTIRGKIGEAARAYLTAPPEARRESAGTIGGLMVQLGANPTQVADSLRNLESLVNSTTDPRLAAQQAKVPAVFRPDAATTAEEGQQIMGADQAARTDRAVEVAKVRGSIAQTLAKGGQPGQPNQMELNRQAEAVKIGAEWAMKTPLVGGALFDEGQAFRVSQAARNAYPNLPIQDAIVKFIADNKSIFEENEEYLPGFLGGGDNFVEMKGQFPAVAVPVAPAARPVASAPRANDSWKGAPSMSMQSAPGQAAQTAPAQGGMPTKSQFAALPEGGSVMVGGVKYVKQGRQLIPVK